MFSQHPEYCLKSQFNNPQNNKIDHSLTLIDKALNAPYKVFVRMVKIKIISLSTLILPLIFASQTEIPLQNNCKEILKPPHERDQHILMQEIFAPGDALVNELFEKSGFSFEDRHLMSKQQRKDFLKQNASKIHEHLINQGTELIPFSQENQSECKTCFFVKGGHSRLGRVAKALWEKRRYSLIIDFNIFDQYAYFSLGDRDIVLSLEDAFYPNQISFSLLHELRHLHEAYENLIIPKIMSAGPLDKPYANFSLDEVLIIYKDLWLMQFGAKSFTSQYRTLHKYKDGGKEFLEFKDILKDLSERTLLQKVELLKILDCLREIEKEPSLFFQKTYLDSFALLGSKIYIPYLYDMQFRSNNTENVSKLARNSIKLLEKVLATAEKVVEKGIVHY